MWSTWIERYTARLALAGRGPKTVSECGRLLARFAKFCRDAGVAEPGALGTDVVRAYRAWLASRMSARGRPMAPRTLNIEHAAVRGFLVFLAGEAKVSARLADELPLIKVPRRLPRGVPSDAEVRRILTAIPIGTPLGVRDRAIVEVLYSTGLRRGELLALKLIDVDLAGGTVHVVCGKGGKSRVVPIGREAARWVELYVATVRPAWARPGEEALFVSERGGRLDADWLTVRVKELAAAVGLKVSPHAFRKACATELLRARAPAYHVKELLGHEHLGTLSSYAALTIVDLIEMHRRYHPREQGTETSGE